MNNPINNFICPCYFYAQTKKLSFVLQAFFLCFFKFFYPSSQKVKT